HRRHVQERRRVARAAQGAAALGASLRPDARASAEIIIEGRCRRGRPAPSAPRVAGHAVGVAAHGVEVISRIHAIASDRVHVALCHALLLSIDLLALLLLRLLDLPLQLLRLLLLQLLLAQCVLLLALLQPAKLQFEISLPRGVLLEPLLLLLPSPVLGL